MVKSMAPLPPVGYWEVWVLFGERFIEQKKKMNKKYVKKMNKKYISKK